MYLQDKYKFLNNVMIFAIVTLVWIFFRALHFSDAAVIFEKLFSSDYGAPYIGDSVVFITAIYGLILALIFDLYLFKKEVPLEKLGSTLTNKTFIFWFTFIVVNVLLFYSSSINFIYFQF